VASFEGDNIVVMSYLSAFIIWPYKKGTGA